MAPTLDIEKLRLGDLIEISRGTYQHWAVYVGNGYVVHLAPPCEGPGGGSSSVMSVLADSAMVKKEFLWNVVGEDEWQVNNGLDREHSPRLGFVIANEAMGWVGRSVPYSIFSGNCEHFVNNLRYGKNVSGQVTQATNAAIGLGAAGLVVFGVLALARGIGRENRNKE
ncbi:phospholipase A and acyltransferase 3 [Hippoglossus stenolepis]|uniref:phospholipase A and acyltransferase 3 n=1 Tax=Hippoglossus stenolepis TaxID=195615 RepID=UPI00159C6F8E|nr:phospholipase A and acyltransferase 3 [Hippoglossus stenolepis]